MPVVHVHQRRRRGVGVAAAAVGALSLAALVAPDRSPAQRPPEPQGHPPHRAGAGTGAAGPPPPFVATTEKPFADLMQQAMAVMDHGMAHAPMTGDPDHDFVTMMIPHHQGAIDMAKALLLHTRDPELRNLAQGIITEQQLEIDQMKAWLSRRASAEPGAK